MILLVMILRTKKSVNVDNISKKIIDVMGYLDTIKPNIDNITDPLNVLMSKNL